MTPSEETLRLAVCEELDAAVTNEYGAELVAQGTSIFSVDPALVAYALTECDWPYTLGIDVPLRAADLVPFIAEWQRDRVCPRCGIGKTSGHMCGSCGESV